MTVFAVGGSDELALARGGRVRVYRWGVSRPSWERTLEVEPQAVALTRRAVYAVAKGKLLQLFRAPNEPSQQYPSPPDR
ncbi:MAG: hypothetical protein NZ874_09530, partial [Fimbriimonadales bacterium]|nr:hypothetical protein [Fimbriimonadales bacterium]